MFRVDEPFNIQLFGVCWIIVGEKLCYFVHIMGMTLGTFEVNIENEMLLG